MPERSLPDRLFARSEVRSDDEACTCAPPLPLAAFLKRRRDGPEAEEEEAEAEDETASSSSSARDGARSIKWRRDMRA